MYEEAKEVVEFSNCTDINSYLKAGWKIVNIYNTPLALEIPVYNCQTPHIMLGWFGPNLKHPDGYPK